MILKGGKEETGLKVQLDITWSRCSQPQKYFTFSPCSFSICHSKTNLMRKACCLFSFSTRSSLWHSRSLFTSYWSQTGLKSEGAHQTLNNNSNIKGLNKFILVFKKPWNRAVMSLPPQSAWPGTELTMTRAAVHTMQTLHDKSGHG